MVAPRKSAEHWLPELADSHDPLATTFAAKLTWLQTPDLEAGRKPDWFDLTVKVSQPSLAPRPKPRARDRRGRK